MRLSGGRRPDEISLQFGEDVLTVGELPESRDVRADFVDEGPALEMKGEWARSESGKGETKWGKGKSEKPVLEI